MMTAREEPGSLAVGADGAAAMVTTASGLLVPAAAVGPDQRQVDTRSTSEQRPTAYDPDGRRRVGLTKAERKAIDRAARILNYNGVGYILGCLQRFDGKAACGGFLSPEQVPDAGFGCLCTRIHFLEI